MKKYLVLIVVVVVIVALTGCGAPQPAPSINNIVNTTAPEDLFLIQQALASKVKWPADKTTVTVLQNTGDHARGGVTYQDEKGAEGGYWFAVKENGNWRIVLDGNGTIPCTQMKSEGFPDAMIPDCCAKC